MNLDRAQALELAHGVSAAVGESSDDVEVGICPSLIYLDAIGVALRDTGSPVVVGAQNGYLGDYGAFTGEVSMAMLADLGVHLVITGHSERRHVLGEPDELVGKKTAASLDHGLRCILCVGETIGQREAGETDEVNERQLRAGLADVKKERMADVVIAYEPVWAIGTGKTATPGDAQDAHERIRAVLGDLYGTDVAEATRIQYGGSMKPENAAELMDMPDIDGGLIGGASLKVDPFMAIVNAARGG